VVGNKKCSPVQEQTPCKASAADNADGIGAVPIFGPRFGQVLAAFFHVSECYVWLRIYRARLESPGALVGVARPRSIKRLPDTFQRSLRRGRGHSQTIQSHVVVEGVVITANEPRIRWNVDAT